MTIHKDQDQLSETISRFGVSVSKWPLSYPTASVHVAGLVITHQGKPIMQWVR